MPYIRGVAACGFGNYFFENLAKHILSKKYNLKSTYLYYKEFEFIGIKLFTDGENYYDTNIIINNENFYNYLLNNIEVNSNLVINEPYFFQTSEFAKYLKNYLKSELQNNIISTNIYKDRYNNNNDVYIHVRLGDVIHFNPGFDYYDSILSKLNFDNGYISSDTIDHEICQKLIDKYDLISTPSNEFVTIRIASTCKHIILSTGTFSWMIGVLSFFSEIYYPVKKHDWHGDIFVFPDWHMINY